ncbi:Mbov_0401 family ICE element transposase-like protein [Spiroplasma endosymbiont of Nebria brevicollis]|uniref:Mbov_0401 family ICE element transposase-like protein n=1 Tax=Spiroplasma endosymbiont of Nebria brevicollis TaxID=3066284 RepID=UPI00313D8195
MTLINNEYDYNYFKTYDKNKYKYIQRRQKLIINPFGKSYLPLRIYKNLETNENICPVKNFIKILKYKNCTNRLLNFILKQIHKGKRQCDIKDMLPDCPISNQTISNIIKNSKFTIQPLKEKIKVLDNQKLHIDIDDCYEFLRNDYGIIEKHCIKIFNLYTHKINISKNRNKLLNKTTAFLLYKNDDNMSQDKVYNFVFETINNNYDIKINSLKDLESQNLNLIIAGDGALSIRAMAKLLGGYYILDKFHAFSYLWKSFVGKRGKKKESTDWTKYIDSSASFKNGNYNQFINILENNVDEKTFNYFKNNTQGIINQGADWNIGCYAESTVFHLVKSLKGNGAKAYNSKTFINMLNARVAYLNKQNISF